MRWSWISACGLIALAGCVSTAETQKIVGSRWVGQSLDSFVVENGPPGAPYALADGRKVVEWQDSYLFGNTSPLAVALSGGAQVEAGSLKLACKLRITVNRSNIIESIAVVSDTTGPRQSSRCADALKV